MTIKETLHGLAGGVQIGPTKFATRNGRLFADVLGRTVAVDQDADSIRLTSPARLSSERSATVSDEAIAAAVAAAQVELGGLSELTWSGGKMVAWQWIGPSSNAVDVALAARETVRICLYAERLVAQLEAPADLRRQISALEAEFSD